MFGKPVSLLLLSLLVVGAFVFMRNAEPVRVKARLGDGFAQTESVDWWPMFHHDITHSGCSTSAAPNFQLPWCYSTGSAVVSSPAVVDGTVFVGSTDNKTYALNATTGTQIWNYTTRGTIQWSSPAVAGRVVYVGSTDGEVYALNATTGTLVWNYTTSGSVFSSPVVPNGVVYVGSNDDKVYALNATTGTLVWNYTTFDDVVSSPAVADGKVFVGSWDNNAYALNASTGAKIWNYTTGSVVVSSPAVADGKVFVGSWDNNTYALNESTGAKIWNYTTGGAVWSSPAVASGMVFVGSNDHNVYALNATTGTQVWNYTTGDNVQSSPAVSDGVVYVGSNDGKIYFLNASTGSVVWNKHAGGVFSSPAVAGGTLYVGGLNGNIYAFGKAVDFFGCKEPAPMGIADYGLGQGGAYEYATKSFVGTIMVTSLLTNKSSNNRATFQLNVDLEFNTSDGLRVYWIQNVLDITTFGGVLYFNDFVSSVWNDTEPSANMSDSGISGKGHSYGVPYGYSAAGDGAFIPSNRTTPITITLNVTSGVSSSGDPTVSFAYDIGYGSITYDTATFTNVTELTSSPGLKVCGFNVDPKGLFYDSALILGVSPFGVPWTEGITTDVQSDVQLQLEYWNGHNYEAVPNAYNFGYDTGELIDNVLCGCSHYSENGTLFAEIQPGPGQLGLLYDQSQTTVINITSPLPYGTLYIANASDPKVSARQIPFVNGEVTVTTFPGCYCLQLYNQYGQLCDQGNFAVSAGQTLYLQAPFRRGGGGGGRMPYAD